MLAIILCSVFLGVILTLLVQTWLLKRWFSSLPVIDMSGKSQFGKFTLPKQILDLLKDPDIAKRKETCWAVNLIFQFLFQELNDTRHVRRWVMRRMNMEFAELLQTTTGRLLDQITVRDFNVGEKFPLIRHSSLKNVSVIENDVIEDLTVLLDLDYQGGFQLAVDVDLVFGKTAYLSVKVTKLQGVARLQFTRIPYTHWSLTFIEDPVVEFEVESHFEGRPIPQITSLIINQIRRSIRKKHTLPNYKIRYKPFFVKPDATPPAQDIYFRGHRVSAGHLVTTVIGCSRLFQVSTEGFIYCTLAVDSMPWVELMSSRRKLWVALDVEIVRGPASNKGLPSNIGITFKEEFILDKYEEMVVVDVVTPNSPASRADIRKNDVLLAVGAVRINSSKQAAKLMKQASERFTLRIERSSSLKGLGPLASDFKFEEDTYSIKSMEPSEELTSSLKDGSDDYINITITPVEGAEPGGAPEKTTTKQEKPAAPPLPKKSTSSTGPSVSQLHRRKVKQNWPADDKDDRSTKGSPEMTRKFDHNVMQGGRPAGQAEPNLVRTVRTDGKPPPTKDEKQSPKHVIQGSGDDVLSRVESQDDLEEESFDLRKTKFVGISKDPVFKEKFEFDIDEGDSYLNVCVWCKLPEKLDKQNRVIKAEKDILLGHVSISLMDIALECLNTLQGDFQQTFKLTPAEMKAGASRSKISSLTSHPGFDKRLCFGDVTLAFQHTTQPLTGSERRNIHKIKQENERISELNKYESQVHEEQKRPLEQGKHDFISVHFQSATYCNFCRKKIWLKTAFQCKVCKLVCHKKCMDKCQAQTLCKKGSFPSHDPTLSPKKTTFGKVDNQTTSDLTTKAKTVGRHRKDMTSSSAHGSKGATPESSPQHLLPPDRMRQRRNSAPDNNKYDRCSTEVTTQDSNDLMPLSGVPRTRSSTSLQDLITSNASPILQDTELTQKVDSESESSDTDDEMNLIKLFEKQRASYSADEAVVTAAKEMGKELYADLDMDERKDKLDRMISKLQGEIDQESENRAEMSRLEQETSDASKKKLIRAKIEKSDEKIQSLALLMLHYCAGLQHCMDQEEVERQKRETERKREDEIKEDRQRESRRMKNEGRVGVKVDTTGARGRVTPPRGRAVKTSKKEELLDRKISFNKEKGLVSLNGEFGHKHKSEATKGHIKKREPRHVDSSKVLETAAKPTEYHRVESGIKTEVLIEGAGSLRAQTPVMGSTDTDKDALQIQEEVQTHRDVVEMTKEQLMKPGDTAQLKPVPEPDNKSDRQKPEIRTEKDEKRSKRKSRKNSGSLTAELGEGREQEEMPATCEEDSASKTIILEVSKTRENSENDRDREDNYLDIKGEQKSTDSNKMIVHSDVTLTSSGVQDRQQVRPTQSVSEMGQILHQTDRQTRTFEDCTQLTGAEKGDGLDLAANQGFCQHESEEILSSGGDRDVKDHTCIMPDVAMPSITDGKLESVVMETESGCINSENAVSSGKCA